MKIYNIKPHNVIRIECCDLCITQAVVTINVVNTNEELHFCKKHLQEYAKQKKKEYIDKIRDDKMKLDEVTHIEQTNNLIEVNRLLSKGYKILKIFHQQTESQNGRSSEPVYVLGKKE